MPGSGAITLTGKLGEVIKESAQIAVSFLRTHAYALGLVNSETDDVLDKKAVHLHMPEGSIGKEGPSAGTAILTALVSLFRKRGISSELGVLLFFLVLVFQNVCIYASTLAMTGEITLAGQGSACCLLSPFSSCSPFLCSASCWWSAGKAIGRAKGGHQDCHRTSSLRG